VFVDQANNKLGREFSEVVKMQNQIDMVKDEAEVAASISAIKGEEWGNCSSVEDQPSFQEEEAAKVPYVGDKEPLSSLAAEYQSGSPILLEKIKVTFCSVIFFVVCCFQSF
jgi:ubiquitin thioesterase protein OTUB1